MSNGDLVLYGGFPSLHVECHRHWTNAFGLPVANESHTLRLHVSETGEHGVCLHECWCVCVYVGPHYTTTHTCEGVVRDGHPQASCLKHLHQ